MFGWFGICKVIEACVLPAPPPPPPPLLGLFKFVGFGLMGDELEFNEIALLKLLLLLSLLDVFATELGLRIYLYKK